jgi:very-short-patch-repair endonuclease
MKIYYNPKLKNLARELRKKGVLSEVLLWDCLRGKQMKGYRFMRQKPIDNFIVDFCCSKLRLIIEIDGVSHEERFEADKSRQEKLERMGFVFLRFYDLDVKKNIDGVLERIECWINEFEGRQPPGPLY